MIFTNDDDIITSRGRQPYIVSHFHSNTLLLLLSHITLALLLHNALSLIFINFSLFYTHNSNTLFLLYSFITNIFTFISHSHDTHTTFPLIYNFVHLIFIYSHTFNNRSNQRFTFNLQSSSHWSIKVLLHIIFIFIILFYLLSGDIGFIFHKTRSYSSMRSLSELSAFICFW